MKRRKFLSLAGSAVAIAGVSYYLLSDKSNFVRGDGMPEISKLFPLLPEEREILSLAALAPSGHNTQPWSVKYLEPFHWIIGNDKTRWLPGVDPTQRETILSIGAFLQNLEFAAAYYGYHLQMNILATGNQDENIAEIKLLKQGSIPQFEVEKIKLRRTVRSNFSNTVLKKEDVAYLINDFSESVHYLPNTSREHQWLNEQTIEANRTQSYRDDAQRELAEWIRFSSKDAKLHGDGLTTASMEIDGIPAWYLRNFYDKKDVMKKKFREQSIDKVAQQVSQSAGWFLITSTGNSVRTLLDTGRLLQRMLLKIRDKNIAVHPMTQIIEEATFNQLLNQSTGMSEPVQFILRTGYLKNYPPPVSLRRPVDLFVHT